jgi:hypothetical protein
VHRPPTVLDLCALVLAVLAGCTKPAFRADVDTGEMNDEVSPADGDDADQADAGEDLDSGTAPNSGADAGEGGVEPTPAPCAAAPCDDVPRATCENAGGEGFTCACPDGFDGTGIGSAGCEPLLSALSLDPVSLEEPFASDTLRYSAVVPPWIESVSITAEAPEQASIMVDGQPLVASGAIAIPLPAGDHDITVEVSAGDASRTYVVAVRRGTPQDYCKADHPSTSSYGYAVAMSGDLLAVGALAENSNGWSEVNDDATGSGAVFVLRRGADGVWRQQDWLKSSDPIARQRFGASVALSGTRLAVGAKWEASDGINRRNSAYPSSGAVYVFELDDMGEWRERAYLKGNPPLQGQQFGLSVAIEGDLLAVGEPDPGSAGASGPRSSGSVWIYRRKVVDGTVRWEFEDRLVPSHPTFGDHFGHRLSLSGSRLAVGARAEDGDGTSQDNDDVPNAGAVYVFERHEDGTWTQEDYLKATAPSAQAAFGWNVSLKGNLLAVGAPGETIEGASNAGAAYLFEADESGKFRPLQRIEGELAGRNESFGRGIALDDSGNWLFIGADQFQSAVSREQGAVFAYRRVAPDRWELRTTLSAESPDELDMFGYDIAVGPGRVAVGAPGEDGNGVDGPDDDNTGEAGAVYVFE